MQFLRILAGSAFAIIACGGVLRAQQAAARAPGEELTVYLMTMGPGDEIFEKFGHTAIWVHDSSARSDVAYNWGLFDFSDKDFIARLARGRMRYSMAGFQMQAMLQSYIATNRAVWAQELNLTPAQRLEVRRLAEINALPENRYYLYDYYRNNCSTLPRDLLNRVLGGAIRNSTGRVLSHTTFREHTLRLLGDDILAYAGAQFALGHPADADITRWQEMFLPLKLQDHIRRVQVRGAAGELEPLVLREFQIAASDRPPERKAAPNYVRRFTLYGLGIATTILVLLSLSLTGLRTARFLLAAVASLASIIGGLAGLGLILAWTATDHYFMSGNENVLQLNPLLLALGVLFPFAFRSARIRRSVIALAAGSAGLSVAGFLLQVLPLFDQPNGEIIALVMPVQIALFVACWFQFSERMKAARL